MAAALTVTPFNTSDFQWKKYPSSPNLYYRDALGGEYYVQIADEVDKGSKDMYLCLSLSFSNPTAQNQQQISQAKLADRARESWLWLRHEQPIVAVRTLTKEDWKVHLTYQTPASDEEAQEWADRTFHVRSDVANAEQLRELVGHIDVNTGEHSHLYLIPTEKGFDLLFHTHHTPFDAPGTQSLMNHFLKRLALELSSTADERSKSWGAEAERLLPNPLFLVADDTPIHNDVMNKMVASVVKDLTTYQPVYDIRTFWAIKLIDANSERGDLSNEISESGLANACHITLSPKNRKLSSRLFDNWASLSIKSVPTLFISPKNSQS
jgi:hypothetical protein